MKEYKEGSISKESAEQTLNSYLGMLSHSNGYRLSQELKNR
jgi:hypothetical protein